MATGPMSKAKVLFDSFSFKKKNVCLESVLKLTECRIRVDFFAEQGDSPQES
jgi:hypothetical protein